MTGPAEQDEPLSAAGQQDEPLSAAGQQDKRTPEQVAVDVALRLAALGLALFLLYSLARPFVGLVLWSVILAVALYPVYQWICRRIGDRPVTAAMLLTVAALLLVFGPVALILSSLVSSLQSLAGALASGGLSLSTEPPDWIAGIKFGDTDLATLWPQAVDQVETYLGHNSHALMGTGQHALAVVGHLAGGGAVFALAVVVAGVLYPSGPHLLNAMNGIVVRVAGPRGVAVAALVGRSVRAVARGVIGVALLQSLITGIVLLAMGVPHAGVLTGIVVVLCILQIGALVVVVPVLAWAWINWPMPDALILTLLLLPISLVEHVLRPVLAKRGSDLPMPLLFLGLMAGPVAFGLPGLFLGPVIIAVARALVQDQGLSAEAKERPTELAEQPTR